MWSIFAVLVACGRPAHPERSPSDPGDGLAPVVDTADTVDTAETAETSVPVDTAETADSPVVVDTAETGDTAAVDTGEDPDLPPIEDTSPLPIRTGPIVIFAVRHCEKESESEDGDPGLTEEGQVRAEALADRMALEPLTAIYATELKRTQETVQPTADDHLLPVETGIDPEEDLAEWILRNHDAESILHAGHSYTLEDFFDALGATGYSDVNDYGQLWILTIEVDGTVSVTESTFGE